MDNSLRERKKVLSADIHCVSFQVSCLPPGRGEAVQFVGSAIHTVTSFTMTFFV